jgi:phosphoribosylaminoimidazole-succinocarboxamide synthase
MFASDPVGPARGGARGTVHSTDLPLPLLHRGKVRDVYEAGPDTLLMVASDRVSAFDVVMPQPIPRKGEVLTQITAWWLSRLDGELDHHLISIREDTIAERLPVLGGIRAGWAGRSMLVKRTDPVLVECVVRGYLSGSAWREYRDHGTLAGEPLPLWAWGRSRGGSWDHPRRHQIRVRPGARR